MKRIIIAYFLLSYFLILTLTGCVTASKCHEKYPCIPKEVERTVDTSKIVNPYKYQYDSLFSLFKPCPENNVGFFIQHDTVTTPPLIYYKRVAAYNANIAQINAYNNRLIDSIKHKAIDSVLAVKTTVIIQIKDSATNKVLEDLQAKQSNASYHLWAFIKLTWLFWIIFLIIFLLYQFRYVILNNLK